MRTNLQAGKADMQAVGILVVLIAIATFAFLKPASSPDDKPSNIPTENGGGSQIAPKEALPASQEPLYSSQIRLDSGNASYTYQPFQEYISIYNGGDQPVDITGWQLKNGKSRRGYDIGGTLKYFPSDVAFIPKVALFVSPWGYNVLYDVVLKPDETAIIVTGSMAQQTPYRIVSFKENICSGFLENLSDYEFTPSLSTECPVPSEEPGVSFLDSECRAFIENLSSCYTPEFNTRDSEGEICYNCVDGQVLSSSCITFIRNHFNYNSCIVNHSGDTDFSGQTWRIFLGIGWEMWADKYETIELFDHAGRLIDKLTY